MHERPSPNQAPEFLVDDTNGTLVVNVQTHPALELVEHGDHGTTFQR